MIKYWTFFLFILHKSTWIKSSFYYLNAIGHLPNGQGLLHKNNLSNIFTPCSHLRMNFRCNTELSHCLNERDHVLCAGVAFARAHRPLSGGTVCEWDSQRLSLCMCVWPQQQWQAVISESRRHWDTSTRTPTRRLTRLFWHVSRPLVISESWRETPSASSQLAGFYFMVACGLMMES